MIVKLKTQTRYQAAKSKQVINVLRFSWLFLTLGLSGIFPACADIHFRFQESRDVTLQFENGDLMSDYRYYAGGPSLKPNAILALSKDYQLQSEHWFEITVVSESLKLLVERVGQVDGAEYKERQLMPNGARILGPDGRQIGTWYSVYDYSQIRFLEGNRLYITYPPSRLPPNLRMPSFERDPPWLN
jgi:hypothetical protein